MELVRKGNDLWRYQKEKDEAKQKCRAPGN